MLQYTSLYSAFHAVFKLGQLPMSERRDWHVIKAAYKALYSCIMNTGPGVWGLKLHNTVDAYIPAKLLTLKYHWSQAHLKTVPLSALTPS